MLEVKKTLLEQKTLLAEKDEKIRILEDKVKSFLSFPAAIIVSSEAGAFKKMPAMLGKYELDLIIEGRAVYKRANITANEVYRIFYAASKFSHILL